MPYMVRMAHLIETVPSSFIWGIVIALILADSIGNEQNEYKIGIPIAGKVQ